MIMGHEVVSWRLLLVKRLTDGH